MRIEITVPNWVMQAIWLLTDKCDQCGGDWDEGHITGDRECKACGNIDRA